MKLLGEKVTKSKVIAEIGCNHKGDMGIAFELLDLAKECGADVAKFQKRHSKELLTEEQYNSPHPNPYNSYGSTYGEHREFLEFDLEQNKKLMDYCNQIGIDYSTSVWDVTSAKEIVSINPKMIKVPSACNNHFDMLKILRDDYEGEVHISLGMTTPDEEKVLFTDLDNKNVSAGIYFSILSYDSGTKIRKMIVTISRRPTRIFWKGQKRLKDESFSFQTLFTLFKNHHLYLIDNVP